MSKALIITLSSILILMLLLVIFNQLTNRSIRTEIIIEASAEKVWGQLMDHQSYQAWNPFITQITGATNVDGLLDVTIQSQGKDPMGFRPVVLINNQQQEFRWKGKLFISGIFDGEHFFILNELGPKQTKLIHGENFSGLLSGVLLKLIKSDTESGFESMNVALKSRVELID